MQKVYQIYSFRSIEWGKLAYARQKNKKTDFIGFSFVFYHLNILKAKWR